MQQNADVKGIINQNRQVAPKRMPPLVRLIDDCLYYLKQ